VLYCLFSMSPKSGKKESPKSGSMGKSSPRFLPSRIPKNKLVKTGESDCSSQSKGTSSFLDMPMEFVKWASPTFHDFLVDSGVPVSWSAEMDQQMSKFVALLVVYQATACSFVTVKTEKLRQLGMSKGKDATEKSKAAFNVWAENLSTLAKDWTMKLKIVASANVPPVVSDNLKTLPQWAATQSAYLNTQWEKLRESLITGWTSTKSRMEMWTKQGSDWALAASTWAWEKVEVVMVDALKAGIELKEGAENQLPKGTIQRVQSYGEVAWETLRAQGESFKGLKDYYTFTDALAWSALVMTYLTDGYQLAADQLSSLPIFPARS